MSKHIETRHKVKDIAELTSFNELLDSSTLTDEDKEILRMHYLSGKDFRFIGDMLGYSESTIKRKHRKSLQKLSKLL